MPPRTVRANPIATPEPVTDPALNGGQHDPEGDSSRAVVEQALRLHQHPQPLGNGGLLEGGDHGNGVRRGDEDAEHQGRRPRPRDDVVHPRCRQPRRQQHPDRRQRQDHRQVTAQIRARGC